MHIIIYTPRLYDRTTAHSCGRKVKRADVNHCGMTYSYSSRWCVALRCRVQRMSVIVHLASHETSFWSGAAAPGQSTSRDSGGEGEEGDSVAGDEANNNNDNKYCRK